MNKTLAEYRQLIARQICSCALPIFNKNKVIDDEVISFFESAGFFYNPKTDKFEQTNSVQK